MNDRDLMRMSLHEIVTNPVLSMTCLKQKLDTATPAELAEVCECISPMSRALIKVAPIGSAVLVNNKAAFGEMMQRGVDRVVEQLVGKIIFPMEKLVSFAAQQNPYYSLVWNKHRPDNKVVVVEEEDGDGDMPVAAPGKVANPESAMVVALPSVKPKLNATWKNDPSKYRWGADPVSGKMLR